MAIIIRDYEGIDRTVRFRKVPGYYNASTYHVDVDGQHVMTVRRTSDGTWNRSPVWSAYEPGVDWGLRYQSHEAADQRRRHRIAIGASRSEAVKVALRRIRTTTEAAQ